MNSNHNKKLSGNAKSLRKNMTKEERHLWYDFLKGLPVMVHRQKVIGNYIADFYFAEKRIVIELDGSQHFDPEDAAADRLRDAFMMERGISVLRYSNADIHFRFEEVCQDIWQHVMTSD